jgi:NADH:ubiquinone oxidoreductase subunit K
MDTVNKLVAPLRNSVRTPAPLIALVATLILGWLLSHNGVALRNADAPMSIMSLELAWHTAAAQRIVASWKNVHPVPQILWDFLFIVAYAYLLFALGITAAHYANYRNRPLLARIAGYAALAGLFAGACDVLENFGLLWMIGIGAQQPVPFLTSLFATVKFLLIFVAFVVSLAALLWPDRLRFSD